MSVEDLGLRYACPRCGAELVAASSQAGQRTSCSACGQSIKVPGTSAPAGCRAQEPTPPPAPGVDLSTVKVTCGVCGATTTASVTETSVVCPECLEPVPVSAPIAPLPGSKPRPDPAPATEASVPPPNAPGAAPPSPLGLDLGDSRGDSLGEMEPDLQGLTLPDVLALIPIEDTPPGPPAALPPPPREVEEFGFSCQVCGTRIVASTDQVGQVKACPDCHSPCLVPAPRRTTRRTRPAGGSETDDDEYRVAPPVERTADYGLDEARLEAIAQAAREAQRNPPEETARQRRPATTSTPEPEGGRRPRTHGDDALEQARAEARKAEAERSEQQLQDVPIWQWAADFLLDVPTLARLFPLALGLAFCLTLINWAMAWWVEGIGALFSLLFSIIAFFVGGCVAIAGAVFGQTIVGDTANGNRRISNWPDSTFLDWWVDSLFVVNSMFLGSLPGLLFGQFLRVLGAPLWLLVLCALASIWVLLPPVLLSMMETNSPVMPISVPIWTSLVKAHRQWLQFYALTGGLTLILFVVLTLLLPQWIIANLLAAVLIVALTMMYFRMLGHLAWSCEEVFAELDEQREKAAGKSGRRADRGGSAS